MTKCWLLLGVVDLSALGITATVVETIPDAASSSEGSYIEYLGNVYVCRTVEHSTVSQVPGVR